MQYRWSDHIEFDSNGTWKAGGEEETVALTQMSVDFLKSEYPALYAQIEANIGAYPDVFSFLRGDTTEVHSRMAILNTLLLAHGLITEDKYLNLMSSDWTAKKFPYAYDGDSLFVSSVFIVQSRLFADKA